MLQSPSKTSVAVDFFGFVLSEWYSVRMSEYPGTMTLRVSYGAGVPSNYLYD